MELTDDQLEELARRIVRMKGEEVEAEPGVIELDAGGEHFVKEVIVDGDSVCVVCSCGETTREYRQPDKQNEDNPGAEAQAREEHRQHYESVMS